MLSFLKPVSCSANEDPPFPGLNEHSGYEAGLLSALEVMGLSFSRRAIAPWKDIRLRAAENTDPAACISRQIDQMTDYRRIGYSEWRADPLVMAPLVIIRLARNTPPASNKPE